jgi:NADP-dependent 3-hydroxy acid dehydrogenase YdfG
MSVVVITGATAGVGRATALRFAAQGYGVALLARGREGLDATAREVTQLGGRALPIALDVADADALDAAAQRVERELGPIDIWINNAMTTVFGRVTQLSPAEYRRVTEVTYLGAVWGTMAALAVMRPRNRGTIVQVGSALSHRAIPLQAAYCGAKHAMRAFTDSLRSELIDEGSQIYLTMVQLPAINTPQFRWCENKLPCAPQPVPPIFQPELAADAIVYAALHRRREVFFGWPTIKAILAQKVVPGYLDRRLVRDAIEGQCTDQAARHDGTSNLWSPVPGDPGMHGDFDARAREHDTFAKVGTWLGAAGIRGVAIAVALGVTSILSLFSLRVVHHLKVLPSPAKPH